jgi:4-hydroxybenzoate polyprenyltransferase
MFEVRTAIGWMVVFIGLLIVSAFASEGQYFPFISVLCVAVIGLIGFSGVLIVLGEIRDNMVDSKKE